MCGHATTACVDPAEASSAPDDSDTAASALLALDKLLDVALAHSFPASDPSALLIARHPTASSGAADGGAAPAGR